KSKNELNGYKKPAVIAAACYVNKWRLHALLHEIRYV
ncbi:hypothetical protein BMETH_154311131310, partial [methanotrophic bacterial endosymbiont of Bathymodiolus sp.]